MVDEVYKNAFKEVYDILKNTDEELVEKIPNKFKNFIYENMNKDYVTNINNDIEIDKQEILKESENILALIYRSYWATEQEKQEFAQKDKEDRLEENSHKIELRDVNEIFEKRKNINKVTLDNNLMIIKKESFIKKFFQKIYNFIKIKS